MDTEELERILVHTLNDDRVSRGEKRVLGQTIEQMVGADEHKRSIVRGLVFDVARRRPTGPDALAVLSWVEDVIRLLERRPEERSIRSDAYFSPRADCPGRIVGMLASAKSAVDICVFTITDDRITRSILEAHQRQVAIRVISDNDKALDPGSDIATLRKHGIPVRTDRTPDHMHHKYAVFDGQRLLTGSYNWTRSAARFNEENFIVTDDKTLVRAFDAHFRDLWNQMKP